MKTVWKYEVPLQALPSEHWLPIGAEPLHADVQDRSVQSWWLVEPRAMTELRRIVLVGTGHILPDGDWAHIGTVKDGAYIWHLFVESRFV